MAEPFSVIDSGSFDAFFTENSAMRQKETVTVFAASSAGVHFWRKTGQFKEFYFILAEYKVLGDSPFP